ncbi:MAG: DUF721 domain-containing protein [Firmicutes bacterium]|nr:DUF721 domain-containing protein [Bacillota bacterium]
MAEDAAVSLRTVIDKMVPEYGWQGARYSWRLVTAWQQVAGKQVADHARILYFYHDILTLAVPSSIWSQEMQFYKVELLSRLNAFAQENESDLHVKDIRWRVSLAPFKPARPLSVVKERGGVSVAARRLSELTLTELVACTQKKYEAAVEEWLQKDYRPCRRCQSPTLKPYVLCATCEYMTH